MKKLMIIANAILGITLLYVLNLKYYDSYYDANGIYHNEEERIVDLVKRVIVEQGGVF